jgi:glycerate kinase
VTISDGGEGFLDAIAAARPEAKRVRIEVESAQIPNANERANVDVIVEGETVFLEVAQTAGLQQIKKPGDIFEVWSYPVGQALRHCIDVY